MTGDQARAARKLLCWSAEGLARVSGLSGSVIGHFERTGHMRAPDHKGSGAVSVSLLQSALEAGGVVFTKVKAPGVRLPKVNS